MQVKLVESINDAQIVRMIRNSMKTYFTNDQRHITPNDQVQWFRRHLQTVSDKLFLYYDDCQAPIGYGYIRHTDRAWGTLAVLEEFHNTGYGTAIYKHLVETARELWLEIFSDNSPSLIAALKNGFEITGMNDKTVLLRKDIRGNDEILSND